MAATLTKGGIKPAIQPIMKHVSRRKWKELSTDGDSVGINDKTLRQGYLGILEKKNRLELEELINRQNKLLSNKAFISTLKDGGKKLRERKVELEAALKTICKDDHGMPMPDMTSVEWLWREPHAPPPPVSHVKEDSSKASMFDSDDDEDPLELLATHNLDIPIKSHTNKSSVNSQSEEDPSELIRNELRNLELGDEIEAEKKNDNKTDLKKVSTNSDAFSDFGSKLLASLEQKSRLNQKKETFKPFRPKSQQNLITDTNQINFSGDKYSSISNVSVTHPSFGIDTKPNFSSVKNINIKKSNLWSSHGYATGILEFSNCRQIKTLSLKESIEVGNRTQERMKQLELEEAAASLSRYSAKSVRNNNSNPSVKKSMSYRNQSNDIDGSINSSSENDSSEGENEFEYD